MFQQTLNFLNENSSAVTAFSVLVAGVVWVLKIPYDKYRKEILSIGKLEKLFALNETALRDNIELMRQWEKALSASRPFSCHFESVLIDDLSTSSISDLKLINKLLKASYMMKRSGDDLFNLYRGYWEIIPQINNISNVTEKEASLTRYHKTVITTLQEIRESTENVYKEVIPVIAHLQIAGNIRFHSLFGYTKFVFLADIIPRPTQKKIEARSKLLETEIASKS